GVPLPRVNGWIEMGSAVGIVIGLLLGVEFPPITATGSVVSGFPEALLVIVLLNGLALLTALPVQFPSDVVRPEPPGRAIVDFFRDAKRIFKDATARGSMIGLACLMALILSGTGAILAYKDAFAPESRSLL